MADGLIQKHGGYRHLRSFQIARLVYDVTVRFCDRYIDKRSRTHDQMVQAARSGVQNIAEGSRVSATSRKMEIKLTNVARASLEELRLDYEDFLRQRRLPQWDSYDPRRRTVIDRRCTTADDVARWVLERGPGARLGHLAYAEPAANAALVLINVASTLLKRQILAQADAFESEGGFTERLYRTRSRRRSGARGVWGRASGAGGQERRGSVEAQAEQSPRQRIQVRGARPVQWARWVQSTALRQEVLLGALGLPGRAQPTHWTGWTAVGPGSPRCCDRLPDV